MNGADQMGVGNEPDLTGILEALEERSKKATAEKQRNEQAAARYEPIETGFAQEVPAVGAKKHQNEEPGANTDPPKSSEPASGSDTSLSLDFLDDFFGAESATLLRSRRPRVGSLISRPAISTLLIAPGSKNSSLTAAPPASIFISARTRLRERFTRRPPRTTLSRRAIFGSTLTRVRRAA